MNTIRQDWTVKEVKTGEIIAHATRWALSEQRRQTSSKRIPRLHGIAPYQKSGLEPIEGDFDMNLHVNNVKYITWTLESIPVEIKENYEVGAITLEYCREVGEGDKVDSLARPEPCNINSDVSAIKGSSQPQFIHLIRNQEGNEINKGRIVWRPVKHQAVQQGGFLF
ncbi:unnamed protein product [Sphagnum troendelagicum]|uniref:Acyl-ACP thioesterase-like C-terminal domain-containing protein n=1 Tax=Sphagnum troendelagicum TaxID=128251 RepID=A0ABP0V1G0_9BRYO